jgi:putative spermidine/putrescine transport system substrate-binding protein
MLKTTIAAAALLAFASSTASAQQTLVLSAFGVAQDLLRKNLYAPFEATCSCKIVVDAGNSADRLAKLEARKANPEVDVAVLADINALEADQKGLIEPIDASKLTNYSRIYDVAKDPLGGNKAIGYTFYATSIIYRTDKVTIKAWKDLWQPALKNRVALPNITTSQGPLLLFMADRAFGGTKPDFAVGIDKVAEMKGGVVTFYQNLAQLTQLFQQDEIYATVTGRYNWPSLRKLNLPLGWAMPEEGQTGGMNVLVLIKGAKNKDLSLRFIDAWLGVDAQTKLAMDKVDSPVNIDVKLPPEIAEEMTYGEATAKSLKLIPPAEAVANRDKWLEGWNNKIAR